MATVQDVINRAFRLSGVLGQGQTSEADENNDAFNVLNEIIEDWNNERLLNYQLKETTHTLSSGQSEYTVGSGGDIDIQRPVRVESAYVRDQSGVDYEVTTVEKYEFDRISLKSTQTNRPRYLFYDPGFPLSTIKLYPVPNTSNTLHFTYWNGFAQFTALTDTVSLPNGYKKALTYTLAVELAGEYDEPISDSVVKTQLDSVAKIKRVNNLYARDVSRFDPEITGYRHSRRGYYHGGY